MIFPYIEFLGRFEERVLRPMIPVQFSFNGVSYSDYCMVDSGSDDTILPISIAVKLGVNLSQLQGYSVCGAGGNIFNTYRAPTEIKITLKRKKMQNYRTRFYGVFHRSRRRNFTRSKWFS